MRSLVRLQLGPRRNPSGCLASLASPNVEVSTVSGSGRGLFAFSALLLASRRWCGPPLPWKGAASKLVGMFTMLRRAVFGAAIAALTGAILRIFGGDGAPPQRGGWREISPDELD